MNGTHIAVIGGGCAGLTAAASLVERGHKVTVLEASSQLGGRARTVVVENKDLMQLLDNGQHILLGAYHETLALLKKIGVDEHQVFERLPLQINMQSSGAKSAFILKSAHYLPSPLNLLFGLITCKGLNLSERYTAIKLMHYLKRSRFEIMSDKPLYRYLISQQQSVRLIELFWEPICLAALNTPIDNASTRIFLNVLRDAFTGAKTHSDFLLPKLDLSQIISQPLSQYIQAKGGIIKVNQRVRQINAEAEGFSVNTKDNTSHFSHVVIATSPARLDMLLASLPMHKSALELTQSFQYQPIYTVYLQYSTDTKLPNMMHGLTGTFGQWVFDRGQLCGQKGLLAVIISAQGKHQKLSQDDLALQIAKELNRAFPQLTKPLWHKVIAEKRATFASTPNLARPGNKTSLPNLFLAGDYTYPDYPATIEGAVRSGINCSDMICNSINLR